MNTNYGRLYKIRVIMRSRALFLAILLLTLMAASASCERLPSNQPEPESRFEFEKSPASPVTAADAPAGTSASLQGNASAQETAAALVPDRSQKASVTVSPGAAVQSSESVAAPSSAPLTPALREQQKSSGMKTPLYLQTGDETRNEEPAVPLSLPLENPIRGISGHRVERFFKTLSTNPVYYHYAVLPGDEDSESEQVTEVRVVLNGSRSYMRIDTLTGSMAILSSGDGVYYQLDLLAGSYEALPENTSFKNELSMEAYRALEANASNFIHTGSDEAIFFGRKVVFEEFTPDGSLYIRYYFVGDALVGHRSFQDGKILQTVKVEETSNRTVMDVFSIPAGFVNFRQDTGATATPLPAPGETTASAPAPGATTVP